MLDICHRLFCSNDSISISEKVGNCKFLVRFFLLFLEAEGFCGFGIGKKEEVNHISKIDGDSLLIGVNVVKSELIIEFCVVSEEEEFARFLLWDLVDFQKAFLIWGFEEKKEEIFFAVS